MHPPRRHEGRGALELRLLGELQLVRDGEEVALPASKKTRALLGYLVAAGEPQRRDRLCDLFWEGPDDPRGELRWSLSKLRPLLDDDGTVRLVADRSRIVFEPAGARVDLVTVGDLLSDVSQAPLDSLKAAIALFRGEFLEGLDLPACYRFQEWCLAERERTSALRIAALTALVERLGDNPSEALVRARALVAADPLSEEAHAGVVRLLGRLGRRPEALAQYEQACTVLRRELGVPVSGALERARCTMKAATGTAARSRAPPAPEDPARAEPEPAASARLLGTALAPDPAALPLGSAPPGSRPATAPASRLRLAVAAAGVALALVGGALGWGYLWEMGSERASVEQMALPLPHEPSIAVLPFSYLSSEPEHDLMSRGLTESLISALSRSPSLFVISHGSSSAYGGEAGAAAQAAEELGVRYVVEGSVRRAGDRVRVTAQLVDAVGGKVLWSQRYNRTAGDILALEEEITARIAHRLDARIVRGTRQASGGTHDLDAWAAYVQGRSEYSRLSGAAGNESARQRFRRALEHDPDYADAMVGLATAKLLGLFRTPQEEWESVLARIEELKDRAAEIAPHMPSLFELRSLLALTRDDHQRALAHAEAMTEFDPNGSDSHYVLGRMFGFTGEYERAIESLRTAERLNPHHHAPYASHRAFAHLALGETEVAISILDEVIERWPDYRGGAVYLAIAYQLAGRSDEARRLVARLPHTAPDMTMENVELRFSPMQDRQAADRFVEAARQAGIPN